jgi:hypothetical protein
MLDISIRTIPDAEQRLNLIGDWFKNGESLKIIVSELGDRKLEWLVAVHELIESCLCDSNPIPEPEVFEFDKQWECEFREGKIAPGIEEPGDDPRNPYRREHLFATGIEKLLAGFLDIDWTAYERILRAKSVGAPA